MAGPAGATQTPSGAYTSTAPEILRERQYPDPTTYAPTVGADLQTPQMGSGAEASLPGARLGTGLGAGADPTGAAARAGREQRGKELLTQLQLATSVAQLGRGVLSDITDASRGPAGSPLAPRPSGTAPPYTPTARLRGSRSARPLRLSDVLGGA